MLTRIMNKREDREAGFTLIELLVVVIIIGILAAIAIPVFLNQRNSARNASAESDARNIAIAMESAYTTLGQYPTTTTELTDQGAQKSQGNYADVKVVGAAYVISTCNAESGDLFYYDSAAGGVTEAPVTAGFLTACPGTDPATATASEIAVG